jgi:hypothetical protein
LLFLLKVVIFDSGTQFLKSGLPPIVASHKGKVSKSLLQKANAKLLSVVVEGHLKKDLQK